MSTERVPYAGLVSRAVALAVDVLIVNLIAFTTGAVFALAGSLVADVKFDTPGKLLATGAWALIVGSYFVLFWSTAGQTPAMRLMELRVVTRDGEHPGLPRSIVRLIGLGLAIIPLFAGFLPVLVDDRRRALQDFMAGTVVLYAGAGLEAEPEPAPAPEPEPAAETTPVSPATG